MGKAILLGFLGMLIGYGFYMILYVVVLPMQSAEDMQTTGGCVAMVTGVVFFVIGMRYYSKKS